MIWMAATLGSSALPLVSWMTICPLPLGDNPLKTLSTALNSPPAAA